MTRKTWLILPLSFILYACPYESRVPLSSKPMEPVDSSLLGYWYGIIKDGSDFFGIEALDITQKSDSVYSIIRYGKSVKGDMILPDTGIFTGYISYIGDKRFMSIEGQVKTPSRKSKSGFDIQKVYYVSLLNMQSDTLTVKTLTENFTARKNFRNPEELKLAVTPLVGEKTIYDDQYSLSYRKIPRPPGLKTY